MVPVRGTTARKGGSLEIFRPSINWDNELGASLLWILTTWAISAACVLAIGVSVIRFTTWGQRFWRITGGYFTGTASARVWGTLAVLLMSVIVEVRVQVLLSYYHNDLYSALQVAIQGVGAHNAAQRGSGVHGFWVAIGIFCILETIHIARIVFDTYLTQRFIIAWRVWLTDRLSVDWLSGRSYYRGRFAEPTVDNPDQRIQQDIDTFTTGVGTGPNVPSYYSQSTLLFGAVESVVSVASFTVILWNLSGRLTLFGLDIPKALFWIVIVYVLTVSVIAFRIGHPLIRLSFRNEQTNAAFRYALVRLRDAAEAVAFYRGEQAEREQLNHRFAAIISNYRRYVRRTIGLVGWNYSATEAVVPLPFIVQAPRLFAGTIKLGDVMQSATAFGKLQSGLSFFRNAYSQFAQLQRRDDPSARPRRGQRARPPTAGADDRAEPRRLRCARWRRSAHTCWPAADRSARSPAGSWRVDGHHRRVGHRQDHTAAQPGRIVAGRNRFVVRARPTTTRRCSCRSCRTCRWAICARWCRIRQNRGTSTTTGCAMCSAWFSCPTCVIDSTSSRTGPRCSHPVSSSASRSPGSC